MVIYQSFKPFRGGSRNGKAIDRGQEPRERGKGAERQEGERKKEGRIKKQARGEVLPIKG